MQDSSEPTPRSISSAAGTSAIGEGKSGGRRVVATGGSSSKEQMRMIIGVSWIVTLLCAVFTLYIRATTSRNAQALPPPPSLTIPTLSQPSPVVSSSSSAGVSGSGGGAVAATAAASKSGTAVVPGMDPDLTQVATRQQHHQQQGLSHHPLPTSLAEAQKILMDGINAINSVQTGGAVSGTATSGKLFEGKKTRSFASNKRIFSKVDFTPAKFLPSSSPSSVAAAAPLVSGKTSNVTVAAATTAAPIATHKHCKKWIVVTTISAPRPGLLRLIDMLLSPPSSEWCMVVVGDTHTPHQYHDLLSRTHSTSGGTNSAGKRVNNTSTHSNIPQNYVFLSAEYQQSKHWLDTHFATTTTRSGTHTHSTSSNGGSGSLTDLLHTFIHTLPWSHFSRKNIGYVYALAHGAETVLDFDDDYTLQGGLKGQSNIHHLLDLPITTTGTTASSSSSSGGGSSSHHHSHKANTNTTSSTTGTTAAGVTAVSARNSTNKANTGSSKASNVTSNQPSSSSSSSSSKPHHSRVLTTTSTTTLSVIEPPSYNYTVLNPYPLLGATSDPIWPRGYPLDQIKETYFGHEREPPLPLHPVSLPLTEIGVVHFIANHDPDVDALYQLLLPLPVEFPHHRQTPVLLPLTRGDRPLPSSPPQGGPPAGSPTAGQQKATTLALTGKGSTNGRRYRVYSPYNAHSTLHFHSVLWSLLLPITVEARFSEVMRSYVAQRLMSDIRLPQTTEKQPRVVMHSPIFVSKQSRPQSMVFTDFLHEEMLYEEVTKMIEQLDKWSHCSKTIAGRMEDLYIMLYEHHYIEEKDIILVQQWLELLYRVGYHFPNVDIVNCVEDEDVRRKRSM